MRGIPNFILVAAREQAQACARGAKESSDDLVWDEGAGVLYHWGGEYDEEQVPVVRVNNPADGQFFVEARSSVLSLCARAERLCDHIELAWWAAWIAFWGALGVAIAREAAQWNAAWATVWTCIGHAMYLEGRHAQDVNRLMDEKWSVEP